MHYNLHYDEKNTIFGTKDFKNEDFEDVEHDFLPTVDGGH